MSGLLRDVRFALRGLRNHPGLTLVAILSLGLGIGANATVFTWLEAFVLNPLPAVPHFDRLVAVNTRGPEDVEWSLSYPSYRDWSTATRTVDLAAYDFLQAGMLYKGETSRVWGMAVSANYFEVLQVPALLGRSFRADEEREASPVAVLGHSFWRDRFAADSGILGRSITVNNQPLTVIGVAPPSFGGAIMGLEFDFYFPLTLEPRLVERATWLDDRGWQNLDAVGRLKPGVSLEAARAELEQVAKQAETAAGNSDNKGAIVKRFSEEGGPAMMGPALLALLGITAVVLLIACANVANLLLARALARRREVGIRLALGATRGRLVRQLFTESLLLASVSGVLGLVLALWGRDLMLAFIPAAPFPINLVMRVSGTVVLFTALVTGLTALLFGLVPALQASNPALVPALKDEIGVGPAHRSRLQSALIVSQVALSVVSLVAAGLFIRSLTAARRVDVGFRSPERTLLVATDLFLAGHRDSASVVVLDRLLQRIRQLPDVEATGASDRVPLGFGGTGSSSAEIDGYTPGRDENMSIMRASATAGYMESMGIPVVSGREFGPEDRGGSLAVVLVNQTFVDRYWPGQDAIGRRLRQGGAWKTVVGVVAAGKYQNLNEPPLPMVYHLITSRVTGVTIHVRTRGTDAHLLSPSLRAAFHEVDPNLPFLDVRTMAESMEAALFVHQIAAWMLSGFGLLALLLSGVGIYGLMSYLVSRRAREIGVRVALGAARGDVVRLVLGRAARLAGVGLVIGVALALAVGQVMRTLLFGVSPTDPMVFVAIVSLLGLVALGASWLPARRASRVDPIMALKSE